VVWRSTKTTLATAACCDTSAFIGTNSMVLVRDRPSPLGNHFWVLQVKTGGILVGTGKGQELRFAV